MRKDTAVAFSRIGINERRERYVTDGVRREVYRGGAAVVGGVRAGLDEVEAGLWIGDGQKSWQVTIPARDVVALSEAIGKARQRLGVPRDCPVFSCYEAGREGFWLHRLLKQMCMRNLVVDSSSIEVNRRARRAKTDRLDAEKLLSMLLRYDAGEEKLWSVVHVPTPEEEDARHLQREIRSLKKEQTRLINRIRGLLANQGVAVRASRSLLKPGSQINAA